MPSQAAGEEQSQQCAVTLASYLLVVFGLVLREGLKLIVIGLVIGTCVAIAFGRVLRAFLFGVEPADPATFVAMSIFFTAVALLACYIPARRATKVDPMNALRYE